MSSLNRDEEQRWVPTHVQVLVIRARGLRAKGKHGTSDVYTIIQLAKEKYSTCVMEKTTEPEWGEECSFELLPGILGEGGRDAYPPGSCDLTLTVMHRALIGLDVFLGQAVIPLDKSFQHRSCMKNEWYKLHSKTGKKEKERGDLQLTVQFTRHNLTASMYDLSIKDKPRSAFIKLRERMRARKHGGDEESSSAIVPSGYGALARMRGRLPSDGGGEEDYEDDEGGELRRSKMRTFFLHGKLRKSSDTRSSTSLGSESSESSSRGGSLSPTAGISVVVSDLSNSPSNSSNLTADNSPEHTVAPSPQVSPVRQVFDEPCDLSIPVPRSFTSDGETPILLPSVCVNGNPVDTSPLTHQPPMLVLQHPKPQPLSQSHQEPTRTLPQVNTSEKIKLAQTSECKAQPSPERQAQPPKGSKPKPEPRLPTLGLLQKGSALSLSLQNLPRCGEERQGSGGPVEGRRWSFDKPGEEEKAAIAAALEHAGLVVNKPAVETAVSVTETEVQGKKRRGLFSHGRGELAGKGTSAGKDDMGHTQAPAEGKHRGWFGSKDSHSKPSQLTAFHADTSFSTTVPILPLTPNDPSWGMTQQNTNPFTSPPPLSPANPFFSLLQQNPFSHGLPTVAALTPPLPSFFSPEHCHTEVPSSSPSSHTILSDVTEAGNIKGHPDVVASQMYTSVCYEVNVSEVADENPKVSHSVTLTDWDEFIDDRLNPDLLELSVNEGASHQCLSSLMLTGDDTKVSVETCRTSAPSCKDINSEHALKPLAVITSESPGIDCDFLALNLSQSGLNNQEFKSDDITRTNKDVITSKESVIKVETGMDGPLSAYEAKDLPVQFSPSVPRVMTAENDGSLLNRSETSHAEESSIVEKSEIIMTYSPGISQTPINDINYCPPDASSRPLEVKSPPSRGQILSKRWLHPFSAMKTETEEIPANLNGALSPGCMLIHSLYASADSEQFLTCRSEQNSFFQLSQELKPKDDTIQEAMPNCVSSQGFLPVNDPSQTNIPDVHTGQARGIAEVFQENLSTNMEDVSQCGPIDLSASHIFVEKSAHLKESLAKCGMMEKAMGCSSICGTEQLYDPSVNKLTDYCAIQDRIMLDVCSPQMNLQPLGELVNLGYEPCLVTNKSISNEPLHSLHIENEKSHLASPDDQGAITHFCQHLNDFDSDFVSEATSSITQDLVVTHLLLDNGLPSCAMTGNTDNSFLIQSDPTDIAERHVIMTAATSNAVKSCSDIPPHWPSTVKPALPKLSSLDQLPLSLKHDFNPNLPFYSLDSPLAASTPQATEFTNVLPLSPLTAIPSTPAHYLPNTVLPSGPLPSTQPIIGAAHASLSQKAHQVPSLFTSPHAVKPLTPPEDKKSEGRSVLEKLKSTIHAGRSHHGEQDHEKKLLVEGGGSYYHLNHSELVSLLLQRDAELQQERENYDARGVLLDKREVEIKKMKVLIRDLEDYIDTLLVRIMNETPTLLQVRSKLK